MLKLGNTQLNKAYIGDTEILKMYLGSTMVFDNTSPAPTPDGVDGVAQLLNTDDSNIDSRPYSQMWVDSVLGAGKHFMDRMTIQGAIQENGNNSGTFVYNSSHGAYACFSHTYDTPINGYSYCYFMKFFEDAGPSGTRWRYFRSNVDPLTVTDATTLITSGDGNWEAEGAISEEFTYDGLIYTFSLTSSSNALAAVGGYNYMDLDNDVSFNGFLSEDNAWSYGFRVLEPIEMDLLGRPMFARENGFFGMLKTCTAESYYAHGADIVTNMDIRTLAVNIGVIPSGAWVIVTQDNDRYVNIYVDGVQVRTEGRHANADINPAIVADLKNVHFGKSVCSFSTDSSATTSYIKKMHGCWQGLIGDLFIANGTELTSAQATEIEALSDISLSTNYASITHAWRLDETTGDTFTALKGGIDITGKTYT